VKAFFSTAPDPELIFKTSLQIKAEVILVQFREME